MIDNIELKPNPKLKKLLKAGVTKPLEKAVFRIGTLGQNEVKKNIKEQKLIDTGQLRQSSLFKPFVDKTKGKITIGKDYGIHHEFGTKYLTARPFFRPMIETVQKEAPNIMKEEVDKYLKNNT